MKKFLFHFQQQLIVGVLLLSNFAVLPYNSELILYDNADASDITSQEGSPTQNPNDEDDEDNNDRTEDDEDEDEEDPGPPLTIFPSAGDLIIYAFNPGYTETTSDGNKLNDVGEFIELLNLTDAPLVLAGYTLQYDFGSSGSIPLFTFPEGSYMTGKHLLLKYELSPDADQADLTYARSLAFEAGPLRLIYEGKTTDSACWRSKTYCSDYFSITKFSSSNKQVALRDLEDGEFQKISQELYVPAYDPDESGLYLPPEPDDDEDEGIGESSDADGVQKLPQCRGLELSELLTYYADDKSEQFIEFFNPTAADISLDGCQINYKNKFYDLSGSVASGGYYAYYLNGQFSLTKNPTNPSLVTLIDADGTSVDEVAYPNGQKKSTTYARIFAADGTESWQITYAMTPGAENVYQKFRSCEEGKIINEATGNCVKVTSLQSAAATLAPCPEGKYRNPLTNRCKNIETTSSSTLKECAAGYERNPETNRCRKITTPNEGADYSLTPTTSTASQTVFIGLGIVALIVGVGVVYIILQFRQEIARTARKARQRLNRIREHLLTRRIRRDRDQKP